MAPVADTATLPTAPFGADPSSVNVNGPDIEAPETVNLQVLRVSVTPLAITLDPASDRTASVPMLPTTGILTPSITTVPETLPPDWDGVKVKAPPRPLAHNPSL